jgi:hypothetical protein
VNQTYNSVFQTRRLNITRLAKLIFAYSNWQSWSVVKCWIALLRESALLCSCWGSLSSIKSGLKLCISEKSRYFGGTYVPTSWGSNATEVFLHSLKWQSESQELSALTVIIAMKVRRRMNWLWTSQWEPQVVCTKCAYHNANEMYALTARLRTPGVVTKH